MFNVDAEFKKKLDTWVSRQVHENFRAWTRDGYLPIRALIHQLGAQDLLSAGWSGSIETDDTNKQLYLHYCLANQPFGALGLCVASHIDIGARLIRRLATENQKQSWLVDAKLGKVICALAMSEPEAGSDLQNVQMRAEQAGTGWVLNGKKTNITNLPFADVAVTLVRTSPAPKAFSFSLFLVPLKTDGITQHDAYDSLGYEGCLGGFEAKNVHLPKTALLGNLGQGLITLMNHLDFERLVICARMAGAGQYIMQQSLAHVNQRNTFNKPLIQNQAIEFRLAELFVQWQAFNAQLNLLHDSERCGQSNGRETAMLKFSGSQLLTKTADAYLQLAGGRGYMSDHPANRFYREAPGLALAGGSDETMLSIVARNYKEGLML
ncbi:acyl-CoA dehydrogenase family protein [Candidatus Thioglobus sp.]|uniref:acyl-CoA dehydrogenase family protein n=1 Tax=Candidatus Thioglobus sp. TaxID=2026721 RepID=UPI003D0FBD83